MKRRPVAAGYIRRASVEELERRAATDYRAGSELVRRLGFDECRRRYGSPGLVKDWPGSWFEPAIRNGFQWIDTAFRPWWANRLQDNA